VPHGTPDEETAGCGIAYKPSVDIRLSNSEKAAGYCGRSQCSVASGVPQGSVLGPLLYINTITEVDISANSYRALYADDVLLYRGISQPEEDLHAVQSDIDELQRWSEEQLLQLNPSKCKYMIISKKCRVNIGDCVLHLGGTTLGEVESFKYIWVFFSTSI
jgi:hypothetical protein